MTANTAGGATVKLVRLDFLDALRGLAAFYVIIYHMMLLPEPDLVPPRWLSLVAHNGGMGVTLFFVVSAFSLYYTMPLRQREPMPWASFFIHRFFRIAPLFYLWILLSMVRDKISFDVGHGLGEIVASATFVFNLLPQQQEGFVWAGWTIGIEMAFYAVFPLYYMIAGDRWKSLMLAIWLLIGWIAVKGVLDYFPLETRTRDMFVQWSFIRHLPVFACGAIGYHLLVSDGKPTHRSPGFGMALSSIGALIYVGLVNGWTPNILGDQYYWQAAAFLLLVLGLGWAPVRVLVNRFTVYLGRISYSLYLNHPTVVFLLAPIYAWIYDRQLGLTLSFIGCFVATIIALIPLSELTYRLVEVPGVKLGKKVNLYLRERNNLRLARASQN